MISSSSEAATDEVELRRAGGCSSASSWVTWDLTRDDGEDMAKWWWPDDDDAAVDEVWRAGCCSCASSWVARGLTHDDNEDMTKWWWPDDDDAAADDVGAISSLGGMLAAFVDEEGAAGARWVARCCGKFYLGRTLAFRGINGALPLQCPRWCGVLVGHHLHPLRLYGLLRLLLLRWSHAAGLVVIEGQDTKTLWM